jgi:hypothetical protein
MGLLKLSYKEFSSYMGEIVKLRKQQQDVAKGLSTLIDNVGWVTLGEGMESAYVKLLEQITGDTGWIDWFVYESYFGENGEKFAYASPDRTAPTTLKEIYRKLYPSETIVKSLSKVEK